MALTQRGGFEAYRGKQLFHWLYQKGADSFDECVNLPSPFREFLAERYDIGKPVVERALGQPDATQKILYRLGDGEAIEGVLMRDKGRASLCVSTQVGCVLKCAFCLTGAAGWRRDLAAGEIAGQVLAARALLREGEILNNMVFMGMGEPLLNVDAVLAALRLIVSPQAIGFSSRRITVSTSGIVPGITALGESGIDVSLAVSLNAATDALRSRLMPINRKWPLDLVVSACRAFAKKMPNRRRITFEYVLLGGVNDSETEARRLVRLVRGIPCKINLIVFNPHPSLGFYPASEERQEKFRSILSSSNYTVAVRHSKGREIQAACGQLAGHAREIETGAAKQR